MKWADGCPVMCDRNSPNAIISSVYWVCYIVISALVMLSLFIGAVTMSMTESIEEMKNVAPFPAPVSKNQMTNALSPRGG